MEAQGVSINQRGIVRIQIAGLREEADQAPIEARLHAEAAAGKVEFLYAVPATPPHGFDWCRDFVFGKAPRARHSRGVVAP